MRDEVEEFLRRAAARRAQAEAKRREQQQQAAPQQQRPAPIQRAPLRQTPLETEPVVEIIEAEEADTSQRFSSTVAQHMRGTQDIARHAASLGSEVDQADDKLTARLHKTFDHQLGQLKDTTGPIPRTAAQVAEAQAAVINLRQLLANPQSIRNAIILSEVLTRPEQRWD